MQHKSSFSFDFREILKIRRELLGWYEKAKRDLAWRSAATSSSKQQHAYAVWVSEIMLQQTRVATVIDYYNRWMSKWPTVGDLANADLNQVNEVWSGLGYYSRARRLHEGAQIIITKLEGQIPETSKDLMKLIPGVGRYTAAAISSIAYNERVGVLDGNVIRVLCRLLTIGGDVTSKKVLDHLWMMVDKLISEKNPGDFNQALMELGALVCTPKSPQCAKCPLKSICRAFREVEQYGKENISAVGKSKKRKSSGDAENSNNRKKMKTEQESAPCVVDIEGCHSFLQLPTDNPWISQLGVMNYPRKSAKKPPRRETAIVSVIEMNDNNGIYYLINQRPKSGLLAGLWEFPTVMLNEESMSGSFSEVFSPQNSVLSSTRKTFIAKYSDPIIMEHLVDTKIIDRRHKGEYTHVFSHIHLRYIIDHVKVTSNSDNNNLKMDGNDYSSSCWRWISKEGFATCAVSSAMHKILKICNSSAGGCEPRAKFDGKQKTIESFFGVTSKSKGTVKTELI